MAYYKDINLNFELKNNGDLKVDEDEYAIFNSINNILSTMQGSRRMLPEFAENLNSLLFDPIDEITAEYIEDVIEEAIERWDDRVTVVGIVADPRPDENKYVITLTLEVTNIGKMEIKKDILKY